MVLGKLPVPGRPTSLDKSRARAVGSDGGCLDIFTLIYPSSPLSPSLWETTRYRLKYCLKGSLSQKNNQPTNYSFSALPCHSVTRRKVNIMSFSFRIWESLEWYGGWSGGAMVLGNFQCRGVLQFGK